MIFDTDVLIFAMRGERDAARAVNAVEERSISAVTYMELIQGSRDKQELKSIKSFLIDLEFKTLPITENISHRASIYIEEHALRSGLRVADALIAATAAENAESLVTGNMKHFKAIEEITVKSF